MKEKEIEKILVDEVKRLGGAGHTNGQARAMTGCQTGLCSCRIPG